MPVRAFAANAKILTWARERAGLTIPEVARRIGKPPEAIQEWESGETAPTFNQLETLAESVYRRPLALFFLPEPPEEGSPQREFRTLPDFEIDTLASDTRYALRVAKSYQDSIRELTGGRRQTPRLIIEDVRLTSDSDLRRFSTTVREYLGVTLTQQQQWSSTRQAVGEWREAIEAAGVFVFKRSLKQREISGFCLFDETFPVIVVNNSTPFTRQTFTLFHELAHLLFRVSSITKADPNFEDRFVGAARDIEATCNRFAAEFLLPQDSFPWNRIRRETLPSSVAEIAALYNVSREVVLRRVLDQGLVDRDTYAILAGTWAEEASTRGEEGGGNYYATQVAYLSRPFLELALSRYRAGLLSISDAAEHLGIKARNLSKLEAYASEEAERG